MTNVTILPRQPQCKMKIDSCIPYEQNVMHEWKELHHLQRRTETDWLRGIYCRYSPDRLQCVLKQVALFIFLRTF